jgi:hypothetical protein
MSLQGIAVGMNEAGLNQCSASLFKTATSLFNGSQATPYGITAYWTLKVAPVFNLSRSPAALPHMVSALEEAATKLPEGAEFNAEQAANDTPSFSVQLSPVEIVLKDDQTGDESKFSIDVTVYCVAQVIGGKVQLVAVKATNPPLPDPITNMVVDKIILPLLVNMITSIFQGLSIPPISVAGVQMIAPNIVIQDRKLVAFTAPVGVTAGISRDMTFPDNPFFVLIDNPSLQMITNVNVGSGKTASGSGSVGTSAGGADYKYSITVAQPSVALNGTGLNVGFNLSGSASAEVTLLWVPIGVGFNAYGQPNPSATASFQITRSSIDLVMDNVSPFIPLLSPTGNPLQWILSAILTPVMQAVTAAVVPMLTMFIHGIRFTSFDIPQFSINSGGVNLNITPSGLNAMNWQGYLGFTGILNIS